MALYEFQCEKCGAEFEKDMPMGSATKPKCPACGSARTTKIFSAAGISFKGSGFYVTDSRGNAGKNSGTATAKPAADGGSAEQTPASSAGQKPAAADTAPATPAQKPAAPEKSKGSSKAADSKKG
jgi:putative FmdB family regulatory protein